MQPASWIDWLEERFGHLAIPRITRGIVVLNILVFLLHQMNPEFTGMLTLDPEAVMRGEVWRLVSYIFIPDLQSGFFMIFVVFYLLLTWFIGDALEESWGPFKLNLYLLIGLIAFTIVAFVFVREKVPNASLYSSLLLAFGTVYPKYELMFFPFPFGIQARYLSGFIGLLLLAYFIFTPELRLIIAASVANYAVFFIPSAIDAWKQHRATQQRRARFQSGKPKARKKTRRKKK